MKGDKYMDKIGFVDASQEIPSVKGTLQRLLGFLDCIAIVPISVYKRFCSYGRRSVSLGCKFNCILLLSSCSQICMHKAEQWLCFYLLVQWNPIESCMYRSHDPGCNIPATHKDYCIEATELCRHA